jgi:hypothetical protein
LLERKWTAKDDWTRWTMKNSETTLVSSPSQTKKEPKYFFFYCPDLDLWSLGRTREEAQKKLEEDLRRLQMRCSKYN